MKPLKHTFALLIIFSLLCCTKKTQRDFEVEEMDKRIQKAETEISDVDVQIAKEKDNPGLQYSLGQQKELMKSRLERLKYNRKILEPKKTGH